MVAVQDPLPLATAAASTSTDTPHTLAATAIGTCAVTGILSRFTCSETERLLSTFWRLTLTNVGTLEPPLVPVPGVPVAPAVEEPPTGAGDPALTSPAELGAAFWVLQAAMVSAPTARPGRRSMSPTRVASLRECGRRDVAFAALEREEVRLGTRMVALILRYRLFGR